MEQRRIGELAVSVVGLGCNQLGTAYCDEPTSRRVVGEALDAGITYFDTADEYGSNYADHDDPVGWGRSEEYLGRALGKHRGEVVIGSKFGVRPHGEREGGGASARWARTAVEATLRRLGTDHVDLYQVHFPDATVPVEETLEVLDELVRAGKVREIGCCNFTGAALEEAAEAAASGGWRPFASIQSPLNLIQRAALDDVMPAADRLGMAFIPYYPLASGMLTGKYRRGQPPPPTSRLADQVGDDVRARLLSDRSFARLEALEALAAEHGRSLLELAVGWLLGHPNVATVIAGAARPGQAAANAASAGWRLTPEQVARATSVVARATGGPAGRSRGGSDHGVSEA